MPKKWEIKRQNPGKVEALARALDLSPVTAWILLNREIEDPELARHFLSPSLEQLRPEVALKDLDLAVARLLSAIQEGQCIGIHGDYDVDGITGAAILARFFKDLGMKVVIHLPHRAREGYGMKPAGVDALVAKGADLIIAVDCGIADHEAMSRARQMGRQVIVVDHHHVPDILPEAYAIIDPLRLDCEFSFPELSGAGLAYYLLIALRASLRDQGFFKTAKGSRGRGRTEPNLREYLDMVALGTIADVVPLKRANRVLVQFGLKELDQGSRPGVKMLKKVAGIQERRLTYGMVAFYLAPRINAAGRMNNAETGLNLLLTRDLREARILAEDLDKKNSLRQRVEERILKEAVDKIEAEGNWQARRSLVVGGQDWHPGVIGIVASRLVERYYRPAAVISFSEGIGKGSLRSIPGLHLYDALSACRDHLIRYGGHKQAAGITIAEACFEDFCEGFEAAVAERTRPEDFEERLFADAEWSICRVNRELLEELESLAPFGPGNPEPCLVARGVKVVHSRLAKGKHVILVLEEGGETRDAIAFRMAEHLPDRGEILDIAYTPELDYYQGQERIRLRIKDLHRLGAG
jgi:single-stranded-DNA-specific exonuclease